MSESSTTGSAFDLARPLTTYRREPPVQALLESWSAISPRAVLSKARAGTVGAPVPLEALVAVARAFARSGAIDQAWTIVEIIADRTAAKTYRHLVVWGIADARFREDITRDILQMMSQCILSTSPQHEFWECRFWICFERRVRTILRDFRRANANDVSWEDIVAEPVSDGEQDFIASGAMANISWTDSVVARDLLARLPEPMRTAFYLKHYCGYKEESQENEPTIASALQVTGRSVRNYLTRAEQLLSKWRVEASDD